MHEVDLKRSTETQNSCYYLIHDIILAGFIKKGNCICPIPISLVWSLYRYSNNSRCLTLRGKHVTFKPFKHVLKNWVSISKCMNSISNVWKHKLECTVVVYMSFYNLEYISHRLKSVKTLCFLNNTTIGFSWYILSVQLIC